MTMRNLDERGRQMRFVCDVLDDERALAAREFDAAIRTFSRAEDPQSSFVSKCDLDAAIAERAWEEVARALARLEKEVERNRPNRPWEVSRRTVRLPGEGTANRARTLESLGRERSVPRTESRRRPAASKDGQPREDEVKTVRSIVERLGRDVKQRSIAAELEKGGYRIGHGKLTVIYVRLRREGVYTGLARSRGPARRRPWSDGES